MRFDENKLFIDFLMTLLTFKDLVKVSTKLLSIIEGKRQIILFLFVQYRKSLKPLNLIQKKMKIKDYGNGVVSHLFCTTKVCDSNNNNMYI